MTEPLRVPTEAEVTNTVNAFLSTAKVLRSGLFLGDNVDDVKASLTWLEGMANSIKPTTPVFEAPKTELKEVKNDGEEQT